MLIIFSNIGVMSMRMIYNDEMFSKYDNLGCKLTMYTNLEKEEFKEDNALSKEDNALSKDEYDKDMQMAGKEWEHVTSSNHEELQKQLDDFMQMYHMGDVVKGKVCGTVRGGLCVQLNSIKAFLHKKHVMLRYTNLPVPSEFALKLPKSFKSMLGKTFDFILKDTDKTRCCPVISHIAMARKEAMEWNKTHLEELNQEKVYHGIINIISSHGVYINVGNVLGYIPLGMLSWRKISHPSEVIGIGDKIKVKLSEKQKDCFPVFCVVEGEGSPWYNIEEKYPFGAMVKVRITEIFERSVFVELDWGAKGIILDADMSLSLRKKRFRKLLRVGDMVIASVLRIDKNYHMIFFSLRWKEDEFWINIDERYCIGSRIKGKVVDVMRYGAFVEIEEGIVGLIHNNEISWTKKVTDANDYFKKGDVVEAAIINIDKSNQRISLSLRQCQENPWHNLKERYPIGSCIRCRVTKKVSFGYFVQVNEEIEGLIHASEICMSTQNGDLSEPLKVGNVIDTYVLCVDEINQHVGLTMRRMPDAQWFKVKSTFSLGDVVEGVVGFVWSTQAIIMLAGGAEGILHATDISASGCEKMTDVLKPGDAVCVCIKDICDATRRIFLTLRPDVAVSIGMKESKKRMLEGIP